MLGQETCSLMKQLILFLAISEYHMFIYNIKCVCYACISLKSIPFFLKSPPCVCSAPTTPMAFAFGLDCHSSFQYFFSISLWISYKVRVWYSPGNGSVRFQDTDTEDQLSFASHPQHFLKLVPSTSTSSFLTTLREKEIVRRRQSFQRPVWTLVVEIPSCLLCQWGKREWAVLACVVGKLSVIISTLGYKYPGLGNEYSEALDTIEGQWCTHAAIRGHRG
jgi:hypothetical protein